MATQGAHLEVERSVRELLYGDRGALDIKPIPRPAASEPRLMGGGRYRLLERLSAGGMATVHRARDERLKREVAVKLIARRYAHDARFVSLFRREAEVGARLWHPNVIAVLDVGAEPRDFLVMELLDGGDAGRMLRRRGRLREARRLRDRHRRRTGRRGARGRRGGDPPPRRARGAVGG